MITPPTPTPWPRSHSVTVLEFCAGFFYLLFSGQRPEEGSHGKLSVHYLVRIPRITARVQGCEQLCSYALELRHFYFIRGVSFQPLAKQIGQDRKSLFFFGSLSPNLSSIIQVFKTERKGGGAALNILCFVTCFHPRAGTVENRFY